MFLAAIVECYTENDVSIIGMGDDTFEPENYIIISRFDDGDVNDSIGIQTHLSENEISNAIAKVFFRKNKIVFFINEISIPQVKNSKIEVGFTHNTQLDICLLEKYINDIFINSSTIVDIDLS